MKAKDILNNSAKKNMINWSEKDFKKSHPRLYKTIIEAINKALIIDSVVGQSEQFYCIADKVGAAGDCKSQCESCKETGK